MTRRARHTGTVERTRQGTYRLRLTDANGRRHDLGTVPTVAEAEVILAAAREEMATATPRPSGGATLAEYGEAWLRTREAVSVRLGAKDRSRWRSHVEGSLLAELPVRSLTVADVRAWVDTLARSRAKRGCGHRTDADRPISRSTAQNALNILRACLSQAVEDQVLPVNPAFGVKLPKRRVDLVAATREPWTWLSEHEQEQLLAATPEPERWVVAWAIGTGMREGEVWALRLDDVRHDAPHPHVVVRYGSGDGPTKTRRVRYVPLLPLALEAWERWREATESRPNPQGLAFPSLRGKRRPEGPPRGWESWVAASGVRGQTGARVTFHTLRHTCASRLISGAWGPAWSLEEIQAMLGHTSRESTERYSHLAQSALWRAADRTRAASTSADVVTIPQARLKPAGI